MKFGDTLERRAPPEFAIHNIDYDELKHIIKVHTSTSASKPRIIPTKQNVTRQEQDFEDRFFFTLQEQHERIHDFVYMKNGELERRLSSIEKQIQRLSTDACQEPSPDNRRHTRLQKALRLDQKIQVVGKEIQSLSQLANVNNLAFRKILKKYMKWTRSSNLERRFRQNVLERSPNLLNQGFGPLVAHYATVLEEYRAIQLEPSHATESRSELVAHTQNDEHRPEEIARKLLEAAKRPFPVFDATLATQPLSRDGMRATYWVHPENLLNVQILLLRHSRPLRGDHPSDKSTPITSSRRSLDGHSSGLQTPSLVDRHDDCSTLIICDDITHFVKRRASETVQDAERGSGRASEKVTAALRISDADIAVVSLTIDKLSVANPTRTRDFETIEVQKSESPKIFMTSHSAVASDQTPASVLHIRKWFAAHPKVKPLVKLTARRNRFEGMSNSERGGLWITLDNEIRLMACDKKSLAEEDAFFENDTPGVQEEQFPHAILEVRLEGEACQAMDPFMAELEQSHFLERVRGFSLETHAVYQLHKPVSMPPPLWLAALQEDIRKLPKMPLSSRQTGTGKGKPRDTRGSASYAGSISDPSTREGQATSLFSQKIGESSATSILPTQNESAIPEPLQSKGRRHLKAKSKNKPTRQAKGFPPENYKSIDSENPVRYWNEFDDGSEGEIDDTYAIYIDPNASTNFPGVALFNNIMEKVSLRFTSSAKPQLEPAKDLRALDAERQPLVGPEAGVNVSEDSDDDDDGSSTLRPSRSRSMSSQSRFYANTQRELVLHRCCVAAYTMAFLLLAVAGILLAFEGSDIDQAVGEAVVFCVLLGFVAAVIGSGCMVARKSRMGWAYCLTILLADACVLVVGTLLLVVIANPLR